jgi:hypothetical protein
MRPQRLRLLHTCAADASACAAAVPVLRSQVTATAGLQCLRPACAWLASAVAGAAVQRRCKLPAVTAARSTAAGLPSPAAPPGGSPASLWCRSTSALSCRLPSRAPALVPRMRSSSLPSGQLMGHVRIISRRTKGAKKPPMMMPYLRAGAWAVGGGRGGGGGEASRGDAGRHACMMAPGVVTACAAMSG